jgi:hypothetical protein
MTLAQLASRLAETADDKLRWKLVWEFLEEYRWEPPEAQPSLLEVEPSPIGDERWDALLANWSVLSPVWVSVSRAGASSLMCSSLAVLLGPSPMTLAG